MAYNINFRRSAQSEALAALDLKSKLAMLGINDADWSAAEAREEALKILQGITPTNITYFQNSAFMIDLLKQIVLELNLDFRNLAVLAERKAEQVNREKQTKYNLLIQADWEPIRDNYQKTGVLCWQVGNYQVTPIALDARTLNQNVKFAMRPLAEAGVVQMYDVAEDIIIQEWRADMEKNKRVVEISVAGLKTYNFRSHLYSARIEEPRKSFLDWLNLEASKFVDVHGVAPKRFTIKINDNIIQLLGNSEILLGYEVTLTQSKEANIEEDSNSKGASTLSKLMRALT